MLQFSGWPSGDKKMAKEAELAYFNTDKYDRSEGARPKQNLTEPQHATSFRLTLDRRESCKVSRLSLRQPVSKSSGAKVEASTKF